VMAIITFIVYPIAGGERMDRQRESGSMARMTEEQYQQAREVAFKPVVRLISSVIAPVIAVLVFQILLLGGLAHGAARLAGGKGSFRSMMALTAHGGLIHPALGSLLALPLILVKKSVAGVSLSLAALFPTLDPHGLPFGLLGVFSLTGIWFVIVFALGIQETHRLARGRAALAAAVPWFVVSVLGAIAQMHS